MKKNLLYIFADQWRVHALEHKCVDEVVTPNMSAFASESMEFTNAISTYPLCSPHRASLLTGKYPFNCGFWTNCKIGLDESIMLKPQEITITDVLHENGYRNAYIGKYHLDASTLNFDKNPPAPIKNWDAYTPEGERRHHVDFWYSYGAMDNHMNPHYWSGDSDVAIQHKNEWSPEVETKKALEFLDDHPKDQPFSVILSWNPPHNPYDQLPEKYKHMYDGKDVKFRDNVPENLRNDVEFVNTYKYYMAAVHGLDVCFGELMDYLKEHDLYDDTVIVLSSDHGDCMGSHGLMGKGNWFEESINIPLYIKGGESGVSDALIGSQDHMPTLLDLLGIEIPKTVEGKSFLPILNGEQMSDEPTEAFVCSMPGMPEMVNSFKEKGLYSKCYGWRGLRTKTETFIINRGHFYGTQQQCLLYDNEHDPYQLNPRTPT